MSIELRKLSNNCSRVPLINEEALVGVLIGAGLPKAVNGESPSWGELLRQAAERLGQLELDASLERHLLAYAYVLGRNRPPQRSAEPTKFQSAISDILCACKDGYSDYKSSLAQFAPQFARFLQQSRARILIDLNYDTVLEDLLDEARLPYTRRLGSEFQWTEPVSDNVLVLWKIHGSVSAPSTIVISPSEYQLIYEFNALGNELAQAGSKLDRLWTLGVGLDDDDVWLHLLRESSELDVFAIWLSSKGPEALNGWQKAIDNKVRRAVVLHADFSSPLQSRLAQVCTLISDDRARSPAQVFEVTLGKRFWRHVRDFEARYRDMAQTQNGALLMPHVDGYRANYEQLKELLLSIRSGKIGPTWCSAVDKKFSHPLTAADQKKLGLDFLQIFKNADDLAADGNDGHDRGVLVASAAQAAVVHITELADLLGISLCLELRYDRALEYQEIFVPQDETVMVGCNPFESPNLKFSNLMHLFTVGSKSYRVPAVVFGERSSGRPVPADPAGRLVSEDEWEASVIRMYNFYEPKVCLRLPNGKGSKKQEVKCHAISHIPPLYAWGFRLLDIQEYRKQALNGVTREWALVRSTDGHGTQYCKGGGLRDRSARSFSIGARGLLRIGEYDDFLVPAYYEEANA